MISALGRSPGEGIGYPLQYSWASLVAQSVKNLPALQETWIQSLGWEDDLAEGVASHFSILTWRIPIDRGAWWGAVNGVEKRQTRLSDKAQPRTHNTVYKRPIFKSRYTYRLKVKGWKKIFNANGNPKKTRLTIFISEKKNRP